MDHKNQQKSSAGILCKIPWSGLVAKMFAFHISFMYVITSGPDLMLAHYANHGVNWAGQVTHLLFTLGAVPSFTNFRNCKIYRLIFSFTLQWISMISISFY